MSLMTVSDIGGGILTLRFAKDTRRHARRMRDIIAEDMQLFAERHTTQPPQERTAPPAQSQTGQLLALSQEVDRDQTK